MTFEFYSSAVTRMGEFGFVYLLGGCEEKAQIGDNTLKSLNGHVMTLIEVLVERIKETKSLENKEPQLICALALVYYSGVKKKELTKLTVGDVLGRDGEIVASIDRFSKKIPITEEARAALRAYLKTPRERDVRLKKKTSPLFPSYKTEQNLTRGWELVGMLHRCILEEGIRDYFSSLDSEKETSLHSIKETADHFRKSQRSIRDTEKGKNKRGKADVFSRLMKYADEAAALRSDRAEDQKRAQEILTETAGLLANAKFEKHRRFISSQIEEIRNSLSRVLTPPATKPKVEPPSEPDGRNYKQILKEAMEASKACAKPWIPADPVDE